MELWNYCPNCGKRLYPNEDFCLDCGAETILDGSDEVFIFTPPIHNIGFFDLKIDFSPYIESNADFKYEICACGYINMKDNEFCYHCGRKRIVSRLSGIIRREVKPKFIIEDFLPDAGIVCECGALNDESSEFCDMCGRRLHEEEVNDNFSNFNLEFENPIFCSCGEENQEDNQFCRNCGLPLDSYGRMNDMKMLCVCSVLNDITSDYCVECGSDLNEEHIEIICICGSRNPVNARFCMSCERPLNSERLLKTKIVCNCGKILDFDTSYCPNCGKNIKQAIARKKSFSKKINSVKKMWNGV